MTQIQLSQPTLPLAVGVALVLGLWFRSRCTRWSVYNEVHHRFQGKYSLSADGKDVNGRPHMNKAGYKGVRDAQYIVRQVTGKEMPFLFQKALEFALFRTYAIPTISKILLRTGNFVHADKSSRRYVDTSMLIVSFLFYPLPLHDLEDNDNEPRPHETTIFDQDDPRSSIALARVNWLHRRANTIHKPAGAGISNDDLLYTLSVFVTQPDAWIGNYGWRALSELELEALYTVFYHIGRCMKIEGIPDTRKGLYDWADAYERKYMVFAPQNKAVAVETVNLLLHHVPHSLRPPFFPIVSSLMDDRMRTAVGFNRPATIVHLVPHLLLTVMKLSLRYFGSSMANYKVVVPFNGDGSATDVIRAQQAGAICPASGARAADGARCPVGGDEKSVEPTFKHRMTPKWFENDPHYSLPATRFSLRWAFEQLFVKPEERYGAAKWQRASKRSNDPPTRVNLVTGQQESPHGFRLEECGPRGVEYLGHEEIRQEATALHTRPLAGPWAF